MNEQQMKWMASSTPTRTTSPVLSYGSIAFWWCLNLATTEAFSPLPLSSIVSPPKTTTWQSQEPLATNKQPTKRPLLQQQHLRLVQASFYDDLMEEMPSTDVVEAIAQQQEGNNNTSVVAADVAAVAGVSLSQAKKDLTALAALSRGDIAVDVDGQLIYKFPNNLKSTLLKNSVRYKIDQSVSTTWSALFWVFRASFGVGLFASTAAIFSAIFLLSSSSDGDSFSGFDSKGRGDNKKSANKKKQQSKPSYKQPQSGATSDKQQSSATSDQQQQDSPEDQHLGLFESVFSYVFGDGDPNAGLEKDRIALVAQMIRENKGSVTAEQLAPFCQGIPEPQVMDDEKLCVDESFALPIVTALDGEPRVTDDGDIVYVFEQMQTTSASAASKARPLALEELDVDPSALQEREWKFSAASRSNKSLARTLGVVNLGGALYLGQMLRQVGAAARVPRWHGAAQAGFPFLLTYAVLFNAIPAARSRWIQSQNAKIRERNQTRKNWKEALAASLSSSPALQKKLCAAQKMGTQLKQVQDSEIVFDTSQPFEDIQEKRDLKDLGEFDKLLKEKVETVTGTRS